MRLGILAVAAVLGLAIGSAAARAADETTQIGVNPQHSNSVPDSPLQPPLELRWQANLGHVSSNVVVAGGRVFYVRDPGNMLQITALRASDGALLWSRPWTATNWGRNGLAYDGGRLFVVGNQRGERPSDVRIEAIDAVSGAPIWSRTLPADYGAGSFPTVAAGELYLLASGEATQLYALRQSDGGDRWGPKTVSGGDGSTPALDGANVYVSLMGPQTYAFDRATGAQRWHYGPCCAGGGGTTPMVFGDRLFAEDGLIHDVRDGHVVGNYWSGGIPTWSGDFGVAYGNNVLRGFGPTFETTRWTFQIDRYGHDLSAPLIAGPYAYVSTTDLPPWHLMALRLTDGARDWCTLIDLPPGSYSSARPRPVAAGHGLLLVSKGYGLAAYASGSRPSACASLPPSSVAGQPSLELTVSRRSLWLGQRTRLAGRLSGMADASGRTIAVDVDPWPFDGRYRRAALARTGSDGTAALRYAPRRNVRVRARLVGEPRLVSRHATVYVDFRVSVRPRDAGGRNARLRVTIRADGRAQVLRRRVYGYLARAGKPWRRVAHGRWRLGPRSATTTLRYPRGRLRRGDHSLVCTPERKPDAFGRPKRIDRLCGRRTLPR